MTNTEYARERSEDSILFKVKIINERENGGEKS